MYSRNEVTDSGPFASAPSVSSSAGLTKGLSEAERTRVLIVDDSAAMQRLLSRILSEHPKIVVVGSAFDGREALAKIPQLAPHVVTLDIDMPGMDGMEALSLIRQRNPEVRVIMCSGVTKRGAKATLDALMAGASHCVAKPGATEQAEIAQARFAEEIIQKICQFRTKNLDAGGSPASCNAAPALAEQLNGARSQYEGKAKAAAIAPRIRPEVFAIGSSTGGPAALTDVLPMLPKDFPLPVLIVQHMPPIFTKQLAERLSRLCNIPVVEGEKGMEVVPGVAIIAPGDYHMRVVRRLHRVEIALSQEQPENSCRPAVDVLFRSVAEVYGRTALAAVLTGMGQDGLLGVQAMKGFEIPVIAQDQATSVVWGMPRAIVEAGLADAVLPLKEIIPEILRRI